MFRYFAGPAIVLALILSTYAHGQSACPQPATSQYQGRFAIWDAVNQACRAGQPQTCDLYDSHRKVAILRFLARPNDDVHHLLIPTVRLSGIEESIPIPNSVHLSQPVPNYFAEAWQERSRIHHCAGSSVARSEISLAINSVKGRSQDQLHIHLSKICPTVRNMLAQAGNITGSWSRAPGTLGNLGYSVMKIDEDNLTSNPFHLLAAMPGARARMGEYTLVVVGAELGTTQSGFFLLARKDASGNSTSAATGEFLQEHRHQCDRI